MNVEENPCERVRYSVNAIRVARAKQKLNVHMIKYRFCLVFINFACVCFLRADILRNVYIFWPSVFIVLK